MDKTFIKPDAKVFFLRPECEDEPLREGIVEVVYDDNSADIWDEYLGSVCADFENIFETREAAERAMKT